MKQNPKSRPLRERRPAAAQVRELLDYDPYTGSFTWRERPVPEGGCGRMESWNILHAGEPAGHVDDLGYRRITVLGASVQASNLAWLITYGQWPGHPVTFRDGNPRNLRFDNLARVVGFVPYTLGLRRRHAAKKAAQIAQERSTAAREDDATARQSKRERAR